MTTEINFKAVYYARVSTDEEKQLNALERQIQELEGCISKNGWELIDEYVDEGITGTVRDKRDAYKSLYSDLLTNKFDVLVIKSQDRLMRNAGEWFLFKDRLLKSNKKLFIYMDNKFFDPNEDALLSGIKSILAEEYSRDLSKKLNNAHRHRQQTGQTLMLTNNTWGFDKNPYTKEITINEKEAEMIKKIFSLYIEGNGTRTIAHKLYDLGYTNRAGKMLSPTTIGKIINNPLYKGTAVMNKVRNNFDTKKREKVPESEWIYHHNAVPSIVSDETWDLANKKMNERRNSIHRNGRFVGEDELSGKIKCGSCGSSYSVRRGRGSSKMYSSWCCIKYIHEGKYVDDIKGCSNPNLSDIKFKKCLHDIAEEIYSGKKSVILTKMIKLIDEYSSTDKVASEITILDNELEICRQKLDELDWKYLDNNIDENTYKRMASKMTDKIDSIISKKDELNSAIDNIENNINRINHIKSLVYSNMDSESKYLELINNIKNITVYEDNRIVIELDTLDNIIVNKVGCEYLCVQSHGQVVGHIDSLKYIPKIFIKI